MKPRPDTQLIDQQGIGFISQQFARIGCVLNEYTRETGIDAIIEIREANYTGSGKFVAVQLKSGDSFFANETNDHYVVYMDETHIDYWLKCYLPIIFIIFSPSQNKAYWTKIDKNTLIRTRVQFKIVVPKENDISLITQNQLYQFFYGKIYEKEEEFETILHQLNELRYHERNDVYVSGLELYINGQADLCSQLYFYTELYVEIMETKIADKDIPGYSFPSDQGFFEEYFRLLNYHNLLRGDFIYEIESLKQRDMLPIFIKPLTANGTRFNEYLRQKGYPVRDRIYINCGNYGEGMYVGTE